jgi:hypothetical protein
MSSAATVIDTSKLVLSAIVMLPVLDSLKGRHQSSGNRLVPALDWYGLKFTEVESVPTGRVN